MIANDAGEGEKKAFALFTAYQQTFGINNVLDLNVDFC